MEGERIVFSHEIEPSHGVQILLILTMQLGPF
jgi:hypothetical protein